MEYKHTPVMLKEVLEYLNPQSGNNYIDGTLGGGGYALAIAEKIAPDGKILVIDLDELAINNIKTKIKTNNLIIAHDNFKNLSKIIKNYWPDNQNKKFDGIVFDLGLSSAQLEDRLRGFSFKMVSVLDMAFGNPDNTAISTKTIINNFKENELASIIWKYGEEKYAKIIAKEIIKERKGKKIETTEDLVNIIKNVVPQSYINNKKIHFATRTFQALRIATNKELENLEEVLPQIPKVLKPGGKIIFISYHSLEDRIVKQFFQKEARDCICPSTYPICQCNHKAKLKIITKKVITPAPDEVKRNSRARSAKMRVAQII